MRLPGNTDSPGRGARKLEARRALEHALHGLALMALAVACGITVGLLHGQMGARASGTVALGKALVRWSTSESLRQAQVRLDEVPNAAARDWLAALQGAGTRVSWEGDAL